MFEPALYSANDKQVREETSEYIEEFSDEIGQMSGRCLDIGSGPGHIVVDLLLPKLNPKSTVICSDISRPMLDYAKEKYGANERISFLELDIESPTLVEYLGEKFDHVTSFYCLQFCQDMRQVLKNIFDLLQPGGTVLFTSVCNHPCEDAYKILAAVPRYKRYMMDVDRFVGVFQHAERPRETLKSLLRDVGFEVCHCSNRHTSYIYDTPDAHTGFMASIDPFMSRMPDELQREYLIDLGIEARRHTFVVNKDGNDDCSILSRRHTFVVYLKKPLVH